MSEFKNYAELSFSNPILLEIFEKYMSNSLLVSFVDQSGIIKLRFRIESSVNVPKNCEDVLSLLFLLMEENKELPIGMEYELKKTEIVSSVILDLSKVLEGFNSVKILLHTTTADPENNEAETTVDTEFTLNRTQEKNK